VFPSSVDAKASLKNHERRSSENPSDSTKEDNPPAKQGVISTREEEKRVEDPVAINAHIVYEAIRREGEEELARPDAALAWSALAAGLSMGISFVAEALLKAHLPNQPWAPLVSGFAYSVGFLVVILGRQQLFTENTLTVILPLTHQKNLNTLMRVLRAVGGWVVSKPFRYVSVCSVHWKNRPV